jgi:hypothetical protein
VAHISSVTDSQSKNSSLSHGLWHLPRTPKGNTPECRGSRAEWRSEIERELDRKLESKRRSNSKGDAAIIQVNLCLVSKIPHHVSRPLIEASSQKLSAPINFSWNVCL